MNRLIVHRLLLGRLANGGRVGRRLAASDLRHELKEAHSAHVLRNVVLGQRERLCAVAAEHRVGSGAAHLRRLDRADAARARASQAVTLLLLDATESLRVLTRRTAVLSGAAQELSASLAQERDVAGVTSLVAAQETADHANSVVTHFVDFFSATKEREGRKYVRKVVLCE